MNTFRDIFKLKTSVMKNTVMLFVLAAVCIGASIFVHSLPSEPVRRNITLSLPQLEEEGLYPMILPHNVYWKLDGWAECGFLDMMISSSDEAPVISAFANWQSDGQTGLERLQAGIFNPSGNKTSRSPYWLGYRVIVLPLLQFMTYQQIRSVFFFTATALIILCSVLIFKKAGARFFLALLVGAALTNCFLPLLQITFGSFCILIALFGVVYVLYRRTDEPDSAKSISDHDWHRTFLLLGALTAFFDWWSIPLITFGWPMLALLQRQTKEIKNEPVTLFNLVWRSGLGWALGFLLMQLIRQIAATAVLGSGAFSTFIERLISNTGNDVVFEQYIHEMFHAFRATIAGVFPFCFLSEPGTRVLAGVLFLFVATLFLYALIKKQWERLAFLAIGVVPFFWVLAFSGYCFAHYWIMYRILSITIMAFILFFQCSPAPNGLKE